MTSFNSEKKPVDKKIAQFIRHIHSNGVATSISFHHLEYKEKADIKYSKNNAMRQVQKVMRERKQIVSYNLVHPWKVVTFHPDFAPEESRMDTNYRPIVKPTGQLKMDVLIEQWAGLEFGIHRPHGQLLRRLFPNEIKKRYPMIPEQDLRRPHFVIRPRKEGGPKRLLRIRVENKGGSPDAMVKRRQSELTRLRKDNGMHRLIESGEYLMLCCIPHLQMVPHVNKAIVDQSLENNVAVCAMKGLSTYFSPFGKGSV